MRIGRSVRVVLSGCLNVEWSCGGGGSGDVITSGGPIGGPRGGECIGVMVGGGGKDVVNVVIGRVSVVEPVGTGMLLLPRSSAI